MDQKSEIHKIVPFNIVIIWLAHFILHLYQSGLPTLYILIQQDFKISWIEVGLIGSIFTFTNISQGFFGFIVDKYGGKKVATLGMIVYSGAVFAYGLSPSFIFLLAFVFISGIGSATFHPSSYTLITAKAPRQHLTKFMSYHTFVGFLGGAVGTTLVAFLATYVNWRTALSVLAIPGFIVIFLFWLLVEDSKKNQEEMKPQKTVQTVKPSFSVPLLLSLVVLHTLGGIGNFLPSFLSIVYGKSTIAAGLDSSLMQVVGCVGVLVSGVLADRYNKALVISSAWLMTGLSKFILSITILPATVLQLLIGMYGFFLHVGSPALHAYTSSISAEGKAGRAIGLEFAASATGGMVTSLLQGYLIDVYGIQFSFLVTTSFLFIAGTAFLLCGYIIPRFRKKDQVSLIHSKRT